MKRTIEQCERMSKGRSKPVTLYHAETNRTVVVQNRSQFARENDLVVSGVCNLITGIYKTYKGWIVLNDL